MGENTKISWATHTFNPVWGCVKVSPGCDNCYADQLDRRTGGDYWNGKTPPRVTSAANWRKPILWDRQASHLTLRPRVFCGSMCDIFDNRIPGSVRNELWSLIRNTHHLDWLLLTKRAPNIIKYLPPDWASGYPNVWLGVTVEDKKHGIPRLSILQSIPATLKFISVEPLLEDVGTLNLNGIDWVIVGGESGPGARVMDLSWAENVRVQCEEQSVSFFFKQVGGSSRNKGGDRLNDIEYKNIPTPTDHINKLIACEEKSHGT